jgi:hypothetical protein
MVPGEGCRSSGEALGAGVLLSDDGVGLFDEMLVTDGQGEASSR